MSAFGSLQHIFENNPLPENPTLLESLSWSQIKQVKSIDNSSSFTEIFGELHFKESPQPSSSSSSPSKISSSSSSSSSSSLSNSSPTPHFSASSFSGIDHNNLTQKGVFSDTPIITNHTHKRSESLQLCTEGLGFESSDDVEDSKGSSGVKGDELCWKIQSDEKKCVISEEDYSNGECRTRLRVNNNEGEYPPPISCIGKSTGKPRVSFRSYRKNGRFVLEEIRIPTQELLRAHREDGRLKLHFVQPHEEFQEQDDDDEEDDDEEECCDDLQGVEERDDKDV